MTTAIIPEAPAPVKRAAFYTRPAAESPARCHLRFYAKAQREGLETCLALVTDSGTIWDVTSSQADHAPYTVTVSWEGETTCTCEAPGYCKHAALCVGVDAHPRYAPACPVCGLGECWTWTADAGAESRGAWRCPACGATADLTGDEAATINRIRHRTDYAGIPAGPILLASWARAFAADAPPDPAIADAAHRDLYGVERGG